MHKETELAFKECLKQAENISLGCGCVSLIGIFIIICLLICTL